MNPPDTATDRPGTGREPGDGGQIPGALKTSHSAPRLCPSSRVKPGHSPPRVRGHRHGLSTKTSHSDRRLPLWSPQSLRGSLGRDHFGYRAGPLGSTDLSGSGGVSLMVKNCTLRTRWVRDDLWTDSQGTQFLASQTGILWPMVVAGEVDVVPFQW